jgi:hypothetical protein
MNKRNGVTTFELVTGLCCHTRNLHLQLRESAMHLAYIINTKLVCMDRKTMKKSEQIIRRSFPRYDGALEPWPACLGLLPGGKMNKNQASKGRKVPS